MKINFKILNLSRLKVKHCLIITRLLVHVTLRIRSKFFWTYKRNNPGIANIFPVQKISNHTEVDLIWLDRFDGSKGNPDDKLKYNLTHKNSRQYFFYKNIETTTYWIDLGQPELTCQIHNSDHETMITSYKANQNKL